jgi:hypothetical protein
MKFSERYQEGFYQEVYDDLIAMGEHVFDEAFVEDARIVAALLMKRVRYNIEVVLIPRLQELGYHFGEGAGDNEDEDADMYSHYNGPIFQPPPPKTDTLLTELEHIRSPLPLSLSAWYKEVGQINLIGSFPPGSSYPQRALSSRRNEQYKRGYGLDPLSTYPLDEVLQELYATEVGKAPYTPVMVPISLDGDLKYGYSGSGDYEIEIPSPTFDAPLLGYKEPLLFINYLRLCMQYAGFPGLKENPDFHYSQDAWHQLIFQLIPF